MHFLLICNFKKDQLNSNREYVDTLILDSVTFNISRGVELSLVSIKLLSQLAYYVPNFEEVWEAYWFGPVHSSVRLCITLALGQEPLEI